MKLFKFYSSLSFVFILILSSCVLRQSQSIIILITGTSSAGKSSVIYELKKLYANRHRIIKFDDFDSQEAKRQKAIVWGWNQKGDFKAFLKERRLHTSSIPSEFSPYDANKELHNAVYESFFKYAKEISLQGAPLIVDTTFEHTGQRDLFEKMMQGSTIINVLLYCPLDIIEQRVQARNAAGKPEEQRHALQALLQFPAFYKLKETDDEPVVDTISSKQLQETAQRIIKDYIKLQGKEISKELKYDLDEFYKHFVAHFKLGKSKEIILTSQGLYDLVLNSSTMTSQDIAKSIAVYL
jgi:predicted kinase